MERVTRFFRDVRLEFSKVHWPSRLETIVLTVLVIVMLALLSLVIFAYDKFFALIMQNLLPGSGG